jgi:branched-chain amino acid transport system substrate-binding protein
LPLWCWPAFASHSFAADTIKIGIAGPKTGPLTQYGDMQFAGAKMAIEQINAKGGVDGKKLEAVDYDDACEPEASGRRGQQSGQ